MVHDMVGVSRAGSDVGAVRDGSCRSAGRRESSGSMPAALPASRDAGSEPEKHLISASRVTDMR
ncbi:MAG TPA: hypothetical protein P5537_14055, partial [Thauera sp.]|nr:hypothetical protein [Thauera sp.]